ncbi:MAG: hypothetical protein Q8O76_03685 [Chloroflexota bacterium]|nr:hypothetical protein [Chloroflexota bacterium]
MAWDKRFSRPQFGPPGGPNIGRKAPHQDVGALVVDLVEDIQGAGESSASMLDKPPMAILKISGPHRMVDGSIDLVLNETKKVVHAVTAR